MAVTHVPPRDIGTLSQDKAVSRIFHAMTYLARVEREGTASERWCVSIAGAHLRQLQDHHSPTVRKHARKACLRFGITPEVAVGFTMGDSA